MAQDTPMGRWLLKVQEQVDDEMQVRRKMASDINDLIDVAQRNTSLLNSLVESKFKIANVIERALKDS